MPFNLFQDPDKSGGEHPHKKSAAEERQRNVLLIAVAYAANIGGTGVITGSPPNLVILEVSQTRPGRGRCHKTSYSS